MVVARETPTLSISSRWLRGRVVAASKDLATEKTGELQKCSPKKIDNSMVNNIRATKMLTNRKRTAVTI